MLLFTHTLYPYLVPSYFLTTFFLFVMKHQTENKSLTQLQGEKRKSWAGISDIFYQALHSLPFHFVCHWVSAAQSQSSSDGLQQMVACQQSRQEKDILDRRVLFCNDKAASLAAKIKLFQQQQDGREECD